MGDCLRAIQVREHEQEHSLCFHLMRSNGTMEDFSTNKCLASLFPNWSQTRAAKVRLLNLPAAICGSCSLLHEDRG